MFSLVRSQPVRLASAAARAFSTSAEVCIVLFALFSIAMFVISFKVSFGGAGENGLGLNTSPELGNVITADLPHFKPDSNPTADSGC